MNCSNKKESLEAYFMLKDILKFCAKVDVLISPPGEINVT